VALFVLTAATQVYTQSVSGTVTDANNAPIADAAVKIMVGTAVRSSSTTDAAGTFALDGAAADARLVVEAAGFAEYQRSISELDISGPVSIVLQASSVRENVDVSITRNETRLSDTPASVVVLTRPELDATAAQAPDDALRQIAGFTLFRRSSSKTSNPTAQGANLRGISGSGASRTEVMFDGLSLNDAFGGWTFWSRVPQIAVEQAEVLRGGASSFYGASALSGAVNLLSPAVENDQPIFRAQVSAGGQNTFDGSLFTTYSKNGWGVMLAAESFQTAGYIPVAKDERGTADTRANSKHTNGILTLEKRFDTSLRAFIRGNIFGERRDNGTGLTHNKTYFRQGAAGVDSSSETVGTFQFRAFIEAQVYDQSFSAVSADRNTETLSRLQRVPSQAAGGDLFWSRSFGEHSIASSVETREVRGFSNEIGFFAGNAASASGSGGRERSYSVFGQDVWQVAKKLIVNFGGRLDSWKNFDAHSDTRIFSTNIVSVTEFADRSEKAFSPRLAVLFRANRSTAFYASYSRSFRAPTLNELYRGFRVGNVVTQANAGLRAEKAGTFEGGVSFTGLWGKLSVRGNVFVTSVTDPVVSITLAATPTLITRQRQNVGRTGTRGVEIDAEFVPINDLRFSSSYLFADSRVKAFPGNPTLVGKFLPQVARQQFNFQISYRPAGRFYAALQARISDGQFEDDLNSLRLRPLFTTDATAGFRLHKNVEIFVAAENLFNSRYDIGLTPVRTVAAPIFLRAGLRLNFGKR
jgi:outer membrane receptor protein involved in Fe transport